MISYKAQSYCGQQVLEPYLSQDEKIIKINKIKISRCKNCRDPRYYDKITYLGQELCYDCYVKLCGDDE